MAECSVQSLFDDAACFATQAAGQLDVLQTVLLCRILQVLDPVAECDVQSLMDDAACFAALPLGMLQVVQTQLFCNVVTALSGACTPTDPNGVETGFFCGQLITALDTGAKYTFQGTVGTKLGWA